MPAGKRMRAIPAVAFVLLIVWVTPGAYVGTSGVAPAAGGSGLSSPIVTAAAVNTTEITVSWSASTGNVSNYSLSYARFYGLPIANLSVGSTLVYNVTALGTGLTYYFTVWAWNGTTRGPASNVAVAQTDLPGTIVPPFPWGTIIQIDTIEVVGAFAISCALAVWISGRRGDRHARGGASVALARSRPSPGPPARPPMPGGNRSPPRASQAYTRMASRSRRP